MRQSGEKYLKAIFMLSGSRDEVRSVDVASLLEYSRPSVSRAMKALKEEGYIVMEPYGRIRFTQAGYDEAKSIMEREAIISGYLQKALEMSDKLSEKYSVCVGHIIDDDTLEKMRRETSLLT
jgi:DtxR family Mn-dependent transcriptional regulator